MRKLLNLKILYILIFVVVAASCTICAEASVELQMGYYNSNDAMSMSLEGSNLNFKSFCSIMPRSIKYDNGGASNQPKAEYSYSLALNGKTTYSSAETDSGMFSFSSKVRAGGDDDENLLKVSAKSGVKNGHLNLAYGNDDFKVQETVVAESLAYEQKAMLDPDIVSSSGFGSTLTPVPGLAENLLARSTGQVSAAASAKTEDEETAGDEGSGSSTASEGGQDQGIKYSLSVQNTETGKRGYVDSNAMGMTESQLATNVNFDNEGYLFGVKVRGIGFAPIDELGMEGQATGLPVQTLPPGEVEISYKDPSSTDEPESWLEYPTLVEEEYEKFDSEYDGRTTPALWYYLNNEFRIEVPVYVEYSSGNPLEPIEAYQLGMVYTVKVK